MRKIRINRKVKGTYRETASVFAMRMTSIYKSTEFFNPKRISSWELEEDYAIFMVNPTVFEEGK